MNSKFVYDLFQDKRKIINLVYLSWALMAMFNVINYDKEPFLNHNNMKWLGCYANGR